MFKLSIVEMKDAVTKWRITNGEGMTGRELELARAMFEEQRNSRAVSQINSVLRSQLLSRLGVK